MASTSRVYDAGMKVFVCSVTDRLILQDARRALWDELAKNDHTVLGEVPDVRVVDSENELAKRQAWTSFNEIKDADAVVGFNTESALPYFGMATGLEKFVVLLTAGGGQSHPLFTLPNVTKVSLIPDAVTTINQYATALRITGGTVLASSMGFGKVVPLELLFRAAGPKFQGKPLEWALIMSGTLVQLPGGELLPEVYRRINTLSRDLAVVGSSYPAVRGALIQHLDRTLGVSYREQEQVSNTPREPVAVPAPSGRELGAPEDAPV